MAAIDLSTNRTASTTGAEKFGGHRSTNAAAMLDLCALRYFSTMRSVFRRHCVLAVLLAAPLPLTAQAAAAVQPAQPSVCPENVAAGSRCLSGRDSAGAYYRFAIPPQWNGTLVVHAHGGPELGDPKADRAAADLARWSVWTRAGYAYAGSGFHQGGVAVRSAAEDIERVRLLFGQQIATPTRTVLHGQSWGAGVAARAAELSATANSGRSPYVAVLLTAGVLAGGSQASGW